MKIYGIEWPGEANNGAGIFDMQLYRYGPIYQGNGLHYYMVWPINALQARQLDMQTALCIYTPA